METPHLSHRITAQWRLAPQLCLIPIYICLIFFPPQQQARSQPVKCILLQKRSSDVRRIRDSHTMKSRCPVPCLWSSSQEREDNWLTGGPCSHPTHELSSWHTALLREEVGLLGPEETHRDLGPDHKAAHSGVRTRRVQGQPASHIFINSILSYPGRPVFQMGSLSLVLF